MTEVTNSTIIGNTKFREASLGLTIIAWLLLYGTLFYTYRFQFKKYPEEVNTLLICAIAVIIGTIAFIYEHHRKPAHRYSLRLFNIILNILYASQLFLVVLAAIFSFPIIKSENNKNEKSLIERIVKQINDSTRKAEINLDINTIYRDCRGTGLKIKQYQQELLTRVLAKEEIPEDARQAYKEKIDRALTNPVNGICKQATEFNHMCTDINRCISTKNIAGINQVFEKYQISGSAKAIELNTEQVKISRGLLKNYLVDIIQGLQPMYKEIRLPAYSPEGFHIDEMIFVNP
jgi:hypothetical protein